MKKILILGIVWLFITSCKENVQEKEVTEKKEVSSIAPKSSEKNPTENSVLKQHSDYSSLFNRNEKECHILNTLEIAEAINVDASSLLKEGDNGYGTCFYNLTDAHGSLTRFGIKVLPWNKTAIGKEISSAKQDMEALGNDSRISHIQVSETGDTYLIMNQNRYVNVLNSEYDNGIAILYTPKISPDEKDLNAITAKKDLARHQAYQIANYMLKKYKK